MKFCRVRIQIDRVKGDVSIFDKSGFGSNALNFDKEQLIGVKLLNVGRGQQLLSEGIKISNAKMERLKRNSTRLTATQQEEVLNYASGYEKSFVDKTYPFSL